MDRRTFIKAAGLGSISFAYGCNPSTKKHLFTLVSAPEDMVTGKAAWYASTCTECPAGCGVLAKNREGRIIKLEGNPHHPVNSGKLCVRGQSALQSIYDPDRLKTPKLKQNGVFKDISFDQAYDILEEQIKKASNNGKNRIRMLTGMVGDPLFNLFKKSLAEWQGGSPLIYEPFSYDALKAAHNALLSKNQLPSYKIEQSDFILGFGADFLETWLSPVEYAGKFKAMHGYDNGKKGRFIHVGPFMSLTAANADKFYAVEAGSETFVAFGIIKQLLKSEAYSHLPQTFVESLKSLVAEYDAATVTRNSGLSEEDQNLLVRNLLLSKQPLVLGGSSPNEGSFALELSAVLINLLLDKNLSLYDFENRHGIEKAASITDVIAYLEAASDTATDLFMFYQTNPVYSLPAGKPLNTVLDNNNIFKVSFSSFMDETAMKADLVFPVKLYLETWDAYESKTGIVSTLQPAMGRLTQSPAIGDVFLNLTVQHDYSGYQHYLMDYLYPSIDKTGLDPWLKMIQVGGKFEAATQGNASRFALNASAGIEALKNAMVPGPRTGDELKFLVVPSLKYFDGRGTNKSWVNEIPDPVTNIAWESMLMVHPDTLSKNGLKQGDLLTIESDGKTIKSPVYSYKGVYPGLVVMQTGMGHQSYGRYAQGYGSNPVQLLTAKSLSKTVAVSYLTTLSTAKKTGEVKKLPKTDGSRSQYDRKIAVSEYSGPEADEHSAKEGLTMNNFPLVLPIEEGYSEERDVYSSHPHDGYRWGMVVDLDRCIGCSACVAGCYAENNVAVVGKTQIANGREMSWLRIERYEDKTDKDRLIFLPMMCQHCDNAPCESVCPVYAPFHDNEGLNNQIYNRCIGTRFCAQNCPYKVRRFNWFDWEWPKPLNLQLNPDVTARSKGVMEKCSFCVQRIKEAHLQAKNENRTIRDGEVQPACVQTCPTSALVFGNFMDKESKLYVKAKDARAYQVLGYLNTKPAVIYLKKILQKV